MDARLAFRSSDRQLSIRYWSCDERVFSDARRDAWVRVFRDWRIVIDRYSEATQDIAWWNTENSNVSFLASAMWRTDNIAVQEYVIKRTAEPAPGRVDLWASVGDATYLLEAKAIYHALGAKGTIDLMCATINSAMDQARGYREHRNFVSSLLFAHARTSNPDEIDEQITNWQAVDRTALTECASHGLIVDYYPDLAPNRVVFQQRYYPGTTIVLACERTNQNG
jgi:hypothetical protein